MFSTVDDTMDKSGSLEQSVFDLAYGCGIIAALESCCCFVSEWRS